MTAFKPFILKLRKDVCRLIQPKGCWSVLYFKSFLTYMYLDGHNVSVQDEYAMLYFTNAFKS